MNEEGWKLVGEAIAVKDLKEDPLKEDAILVVDDSSYIYPDVDDEGANGQVLIMTGDGNAKWVDPEELVYNPLSLEKDFVLPTPAVHINDVAPRNDDLSGILIMQQTHSHYMGGCDGGHSHSYGHTTQCAAITSLDPHAVVDVLNNIQQRIKELEQQLLTTDPHPPVDCGPVTPKPYIPSDNERAEISFDSAMKSISEE